MITVESFHKPCGCRSVGECHHNSFAGLDALDALVDAFAAEMKKKLRRKALEGRSGWDDPACAESIRASMLEHAQRGPGQEVDVANLAAMLWNMGSNDLGNRRAAFGASELTDGLCGNGSEVGAGDTAMKGKQ